MDKNELEKKIRPWVERLVPFLLIIAGLIAGFGVHAFLDRWGSNEACQKDNGIMLQSGLCIPANMTYCKEEQIGNIISVPTLNISEIK